MVTIYALKARFQRLLSPLVARLYAVGVTANQVTVAACVMSVGIGFVLIDAPAALFAIVPIWMLLRMALNAIDGMLARDFAQRSALGAYLNELTDVVSDAALYLPFAFIAPFDGYSVGAVIFASALAEMAGVVAVTTGASRRYDGPMGKSDRAFVFSLLALWIALHGSLPTWTVLVMWGTSALAALTAFNRVRCGLSELRSTCRKM